MAVPICVQSRQSRVDSCGKASLLTMLQRRVPSRGFRSVLKAITISTLSSPCAGIVLAFSSLLAARRPHGGKDDFHSQNRRWQAPANGCSLHHTACGGEDDHRDHEQRESTDEQGSRSEPTRRRASRLFERVLTVDASAWQQINLRLVWAALSATTRSTNSSSLGL